MCPLTTCSLTMHHVLPPGGSRRQTRPTVPAFPMLDPTGSHAFSPLGAFAGFLRKTAFSRDERRRRRDTCPAVGGRVVGPSPFARCAETAAPSGPSRRVRGPLHVSHIQKRLTAHKPRWLPFRICFQASQKFLGRDLSFLLFLSNKPDFVESGEAII